MSRNLPLPAKEVKAIMETLKEEQKLFIQDNYKQSKKSKWIEVLARNKGIVLHENMTFDAIIKTINDWIILDILDGGYGLRPYRCECGKVLRFQYIVHHQTKNRTYKLGETCFGNYTNLSPEILRDI